MKKFRILAPILGVAIIVASVIAINWENPTNKIQPTATTNHVEEPLTIDIPQQVEAATIDECIPPARTKVTHNTIPTVIDNGVVELTPKPIKEVSSHEFKMNSLVNPPIKSLEPKGKVYTINGSMKETIVSDAGSVIRIPANAFVDKAGRTVTGEVELYYCEYNDPFDFITSGIPMTFKSEGEVNHFESAGMFNIQAKSEGEDIEIAKGKEIKIDVASDNKDNDFNFYELDENEGGWVTRGNALPPGLYTGSIPLFDRTSFDERYKSLDYFTDYSIWGMPRYVSIRKGLDPNRFMPTTSRATKGKEKMVHTRSSFKIKRMPRVKGDSADVVRFMVQSRTKNKRKYIKPQHLKGFIDKTWIYKGDLNRFLFWKEYARNKRCYDMRILYNEGSNNFTFELKTSEGFILMDAYTFNDNPETVSESKEAGSIRKFSREYDRYEKRLDYLKQVFDSSLSSRMIDNMARNKSSSVSFDDKAYELVSRTVSLTNLGVYNCDRLMAMKTRKEVIAKFEDPETGEDIKPEFVYVIDKTANGIFTYSGNKLTIDPNNTKCLVLILGNDKMAYVKGDDVKTGYTGKLSDFVAHIPESTDSHDLRKELGL